MRRVGVAGHARTTPSAARFRLKNGPDTNAALLGTEKVAASAAARLEPTPTGPYALNAGESQVVSALAQDQQRVEACMGSVQVSALSLVQPGRGQANQHHAILLAMRHVHHGVRWRHAGRLREAPPRARTREA